MDALFITLTLIASIPGISGEYGTAADYARRASMETAPVKKAMNDVKKLSERQLRYIGMSPDDLIYFTWAMPVVSGKVSTKPFKNLKVGTKHWNVHPEIEYSWRNDERFTGMLIYSYTF